MKEKKIQPESASGFRDFLPEDTIPRQKMLDSIRSVFELFGFVPLDTPGMEKEEILTGGDPGFQKQLYRIQRDADSQPLALRFDLTVPLARIVAQYQNELKRPFKRYQVGRVWRGERPQSGRYREFLQCDGDIVGSDRMMADAEIIAVMDSVMRALGIERFRIRVNNRKILNGLPEYAGFSKEKLTDILRSIDKLDKQGWAAVATELKGAGLSPASVDAVKTFIELRGTTPGETLSKLKVLMKDSPLAQEGISELEEITLNLKALRVPDGIWIVDLSVARGLGYYTGPVFETILTDIPEIGSVFSGGRYDGLVERFSDLSVPATGSSVGVDRLFAALQQLGLIKKEKSVSRVMLLNFDKEADTYVQDIVSELRENNISAELYFGNEKSLKGQLAYALNAEVPVVVIAGKKESVESTVQIKNIRAKTQKEVARKEIVKEVRSILGA